MSTTPPSHNHARQRSASRTRLPSRPTTPLRASSRASLRNSTTQDPTTTNPLDILEPQFAELSDAMSDLEANFMHLQLLHESLARFSENFASFLYGLNMNAFCVDFGEAPVSESFARQRDGNLRSGIGATGVFGASTNTRMDDAVDATFLTTDTSFVEHPPTSTRASSKVSTPAGRGVSRGGTRGVATSRGGIPTASGRGRASGIARGSGIARARGSARGRGG